MIPVWFPTPAHNDHPEYPGSGDRLYQTFPSEEDANDFRQLCRSLGINWPQALDTLVLYGCTSYEGAHDILTGGSDRRNQLKETAMNVTFSTNSSSYRFADGRLATGRGHGGDKSYRFIHGILERVGIHEGTLDDGRGYRLIECELSDAYGQDHGDPEKLGRVSVHAYIKEENASNVTPANLAAGLLLCSKGDRIGVEAVKSKTPDPTFGKYTTYANVYIVQADGKAARVRVDYDIWPGERKKEKLPHILSEIESHPAFAPRPSRDEADDDDDSGGFSLNPEREAMLKLKSIVQKRNWPDLSTYEAEYVTLAKKAMKGGSFTSLDELTDDQLEMIASSIDKAKAIPPPLASVAAAEYDPFADN